MARAHRAILVLETRRQAVNFNTVAAEAAVSKDFLYNNPRFDPESPIASWP